MLLTINELKNIKGFIEESFQRIDNLDDNSTKNFNKNLLWFTFLESIGHIFYSKELNNKRFENVLRYMSKWKNIDKVVLPLLYTYLVESNNNTLALKWLEDECWGQFRNNPKATSIIRTATELYNIQKVQKSTRLHTKTINEFTLGKYLWAMRNFAVHPRWQVDYPTSSVFDYNGNHDIAVVCDIKKEIFENKNWRIYVTEPFLRRMAKQALENFSTCKKIEIYTKENPLNKVLYMNFRIA